MEKKENFVGGEGCCLLCLELKQEFVDAIFVNAVICNTLNINHLIEKYLWTMNHIRPSSWLCVNCWTELYEFHNFYTRIEKAHENLQHLSIKANEKVFDEIGNDILDEKELPILLDCPLGETTEEYNEMESNRELIIDCPISDISSNMASNESNPLLDTELKESSVDTLSLGRRNKLHKAKLKETNHHRTCSIKTRRATEHLKDSTNKGNRSKKIKSEKIPKTKVKCEPIEDESDIENFSLKQVPLVVEKSEKETFTQENIIDSTNGSDLESLTSAPEKLNIKPISRPKAIRNEKDKFLAENFKLTCILCNIPFQTFCNVLNHFKEQHKERGYIQCCDKKFYRRNVLIDHVNYHLDPNYFKCNQCDKVLENRRRLESHCKTHEVNKGKNFCCNTCGKGFMEVAKLNVHKKRHLPEEEKRFHCHECDKKFASKGLLTNHNRQSHLKKYHKICEICGKCIVDKTIFERHMLQHEGKTAPSASCDICGLLLTDEKALERHKKVIHSANEQKAYTCSVCNKISPNLRCHKLHVRFTHESGYNYKCTICDKAFKRPQPLKEHMASHTGEILYTCPWCPKTFAFNANMHKHRKMVHPKEWEETSRKRYSGKLPPRFKPPNTIAKKH